MQWVLHTVLGVCLEQDTGGATHMGLRSCRLLLTLAILSAR